MKKQLLTALLVLTPFFAIANEEISKTELLAHLKNSHNDIKQHLTYISNIERELPKFVGKENVLFLSKLINDIHNVLPLTDFLYGKNTDITQLYFEEICQMKQFDDIENEIDYESLIYANRSNKKDIDIVNEIKLISHIFIKHHKSYCSKHPKGHYKELSLIDLLTLQLFNDIDLFEMLVLQTNKYIFNDLLQKIDAKFKELET